MAKVGELFDVSGLSAINSNNDTLEAAFDNTLSRDGSGPNDMEANLDMNSHRILNLPDAVSNQEPITLSQAGSIAGVTNPLTQETVGAVLYPRTTAEVNAGVTPTYYAYPPGDVRRYGADASGGTTATAAFQAAVDSLPAEGGTVTGEGTYRLDTAVTITSNRVYFDFKPGTTINVYSLTYGFHWQGTSGASVGSYGGIKGARIFAGSTSPVAAIYVQNFAFMRFEGLYGYGFYTAAGGGSRSFIKCDYTIGTAFVQNDIRWCDRGYDIGQEAALAYRPTTLSWQGGKVGRCARGVYLRDVWAFEMNGEFIIENCSVGVHCTGDETTGYNCVGGDIRCYFEGNGKHILVESNGTARSVGINIESALLERLGNPATPLNNPYYADGAAFETFGTGAACAYKVEIDADRCSINQNYWSATAATADILINSGSTNTLIGPQQRAYGTISDSGTGSLYPNSATVGELPTADATPSVTGLEVCTVTNAAPQTITALDDGFDGQWVQIRAQDGNTTFQHTETLKGLRMWGDKDFTLVAGQSIEFTHQGDDIWWQSGLSHPTAYTYTVTNVTPDRSYDANSTSTDELADVLGTLIADLKLRGLLQ